MKKLIFILLLLLNISVNAQTENKSSVYLKFLPSNIDPQDLRPSDIPSEQVLKKMGFSDEEIQNLREIFDLFDKDHKGHITIKDLEAIM